MRLLLKYIPVLFFPCLLISVVFLLATDYEASSLTVTHVLTLASIFLLINLIYLFIIFRGLVSGASSSAIHTLAAIGSKFLLEAILALIWFIVIKKTSHLSVVLFFVLYLTLALVSVIVMLKVLKNRSLNKELVN